jgi:hypothetical protein
VIDRAGIDARARIHDVVPERLRSDGAQHLLMRERTPSRWP